MYTVGCKDPVPLGGYKLALELEYKDQCISAGCPSLIEYSALVQISPQIVLHSWHQGPKDQRTQAGVGAPVQCSVVWKTRYTDQPWRMLSTWPIIPGFNGVQSSLRSIMPYSLHPTQKIIETVHFWNKIAFCVITNSQLKNFGQD